MKTRAEMEVEARRIEQRVRDGSEVPSNRLDNPLTPGRSEAVPLFTFPESLVKLYTAPKAELLFTARVIRHIDVTEGSATPAYKLMEEEFISDAQGNLARHYDPISLATSDHVIDLLSAGFQRLEEDRFWERVEPIRSRIEQNGFTQAEQAEAVSEIERYASEMELSASSRLRVKSDAIDLLEGRLEMGDFVSRTVARQECFSPVQRCELSRQITESIEV